MNYTTELYDWKIYFIQSCHLSIIFENYWNCLVKYYKSIELIIKKEFDWLNIATKQFQINTNEIHIFIIFLDHYYEHLTRCYFINCFF